LKIESTEMAVEEDMSIEDMSVGSQGPMNLQKSGCKMQDSDLEEESDFISSGSDRGGGSMPQRKHASNQQEFEGGDYDSEDEHTIASFKQVTEIVLRNQRHHQTR
jgi:hypothetical protein